jgi:hypothetical protein
LVFFLGGGFTGERWFPLFEGLPSATVLEAAARCLADAPPVAAADDDADDGFFFAASALLKNLRMSTGMFLFDSFG